MSKLNSYKKGNRFEKRVYNIFSNELKSNRLYLDPKNSLIKEKKGYYSKDRNKDIIVDISIESYIPKQINWSQLVIIECKDYNKYVPVDDIEEFYSKMMQIAGSGLKGIVVSSKGFQESALAYARSKNIGLIKLNNDDNFSWILTRIAPLKINEEDIEKVNKRIQYALLSDDALEENIELYANIGDVFTTSIDTFFRNFFNQGSGTDIGIKSVTNNDSIVCFLTKESIEKVAGRIHNAIKFDKSEHSIEKNCEKLKEKYGIRFLIDKGIELDSLGFVILGKIKFEPDIITLFLGAQSNKFRLKFTLAHELGHYFLNHKKYLKREIYSEKEYKTRSGEYISIDDIKKIEWQANQFASCFLLPHDPFVLSFNKLLNNENIMDKGHGKLFVDNQKCNLDSYYKIMNSLRDHFRVSGSVIKYRLKNLGLLNDKRSKLKKVEYFNL